MTMIQRVARGLDRIGLLFWYWRVEGIDPQFDSCKGYDVFARLLFALLIAPFLLVWAIVAGAIFAISCAQTRRQERTR